MAPGRKATCSASYFGVRLAAAGTAEARRGAAIRQHERHAVQVGEAQALDSLPLHLVHADGEAVDFGLLASLGTCPNRP